MKLILIVVGFGLSILGCSEKENTSQIKSLLGQQLKNTYTNEEWFVPAKIAVEGLTVDQSNWKDSTANHSIGELVSHLIFWNERVLKAFKGDSISDFNEDNKVTFKDKNEWETSIRKLDSIQLEWEELTEKATEKQLEEWSTEILNMTAHNAYHTGQILYIRKQNGWWE
ncbi:DinB family protein [Algoriphagus sp. D3-2-R+10]|uniref:DinB family protein n=1 Tax=Algoriphagus aurantiacus TaxID=3103948 RepID=UPI002B3E22D9|nr:DinB family protein [Algoriphagus sp. D3-2-R+10]MEB2776798.1 DinB family protein [Algoriphagus sp. D3-2-R+10]